MSSTKGCFSSARLERLVGICSMIGDRVPPWPFAEAGQKAELRCQRWLGKLHDRSKGEETHVSCGQRLVWRHHALIIGVWRRELREVKSKLNMDSCLHLLYLEKDGHRKKIAARNTEMHRFGCWFFDEVRIYISPIQKAYLWQMTPPKNLISWVYKSHRSLMFYLHQYY